MTSLPVKKFKIISHNDPIIITKTNKLKRKSSNNISMTTELISDFLKTHSIKKDNTTTINKKITNTRIGDKTLNIYGGSYHIPDDEYDTFLKIYYNDIVAKQGVEYLTEKQLPDEGPILIDIDLRYKYEVNEKQHTKEHVFDLL